MYKVAILQHRLLHYRVDLFQRLKNELKGDNVELELFHGKPSLKELTKRDIGQLSWSHYVNNSYVNIAGVDILWQKLPHIKDYDLIILIQENRIISNYFIILQAKLFYRKTKLAFWGHGKNMQSVNPRGLKEYWKRKWLSAVDWWFAYTEGTKSYLINSGFPVDNITTLNNSIDTSRFKELVQHVDYNRIHALKKDLNLTDDSEVCVFCGSIYLEKKIELLLDACEIIYGRNPNFILIVIGDGPDRIILDRYINSSPWLRTVGIKTGQDKADIFSISKLMLNPGLVGLHILDSFCSGVPMITTERALHSPEFDYLLPDENGVVVRGPDCPKSYADAVTNCLCNENLLSKLRSGCYASSTKYSLDMMVTNFKNGIKDALGY